MNRPIIKIVNTATGEEIDREMTDDEFAAYQTEKAEQALKTQAESEAEAAKAAAQAKLAALGLTTDDLKALGLGNN
jgi:hypothetical protein